MFYYIGIATGSFMIIGSAFKMFKIMNESVIIKKREFEKIEKKIRLDERRKIECQLQKR